MKRRIILFVMLIFCLTLALSACEKESKKNVAFDKNEVGVKVDEVYDLSQNIILDGVSLSEIVWSSSNVAKAEVTKGGVVTGISVGVVTITATAGGLTATCAVTVSAKPIVPEIRLDTEPINIVIGGHYDIIAKLMIGNEEQTDTVFIWTSSDPSVVTAVGGRVTGISKGKAEIAVSVTLVDFGEIKEKVSVNVTLDAFLQADKTEIVIQATALSDSDSTSASFIVSPRGQNVPQTVEYEFKSDDEGVATCIGTGDTCVVTAVAVGKTVVKAHYIADGEKISVSVEVTVERARIDTSEIINVLLYPAITPKVTLPPNLVGIFDSIKDGAVTVSNDGITLKAEWVALQPISTNIPVTIFTDVAEYSTSIFLIEQYRKISFEDSYGSGLEGVSQEEAARLGFGENSNVFKRTTVGNDYGATVVEAKVNLSKHDYWMFEISVSREIIGMTEGANFIGMYLSGPYSVYYANGTISQWATPGKDDVNLKVYVKATGKRHFGALKPDVAYIFEIGLSQSKIGTEEKVTLLFIDQAGTNIYFGNSMICANKYYEDNIKGTRVEPDPRCADVQLLDGTGGGSPLEKLRREQSKLLGFGENGDVFKRTTVGDDYGATTVKIGINPAKYDHWLFEIRVTRSLTGLTTGGNFIGMYLNGGYGVYFANGTLGQWTIPGKDDISLKVYIKETGAPHFGTLVPNVVYIFAINLKESNVGEGDLNSMFLIDPAGTDIYFGNSIACTADYYDKEILGSYVRPVAGLSPVEFAGEGMTPVSIIEAGKAGFGVSSRIYKRTTVGDDYGATTVSTSVNLSGHDYWLFEICVSRPPIGLTVGGNFIGITLNGAYGVYFADGTVSKWVTSGKDDINLKVYVKETGAIHSGALKAEIVYVFAIDLTESNVGTTEQSTLIFIDQVGTDVYFGNSIVCPKSYFNQIF